MIRKYSLKLICLGAETNGMYKTYFRYSVSYKGKQLFWQLPTDYTLTKQQVELINQGKYNGSTQKDIDKAKSNLIQTIEGLNVLNNSYPTPSQLDEIFKQSSDFKPLEYYLNQYLHSLQVKDSSKDRYKIHFKHFMNYYNLNLTKHTLAQICSENTVFAFGEWLKKSYEIRGKRMGKVTIHSSQVTIIRFLNYIGKQNRYPKIEEILKPVQTAEQLHLTETDFNMLLAYNETQDYKLIQDIIYINSFIGLRINELLAINKLCIEFNDKYVSIAFTETKKTKKRTVIIADSRAIELVKQYSDNCTGNLFDIKKDRFNNLFKALGKKVFKEEMISLYIPSENKSIEVLKADKLSSHCLRRFAIQSNINKYGMDVARTFSGHSDYRTIKHYAKDFLEKETVLQKLLG